MSQSKKISKPFQAEVRQVLDLVIHSLYENKAVFLRELISNASDALEKLRYAAIRDESLYEKDPDPMIRVEVDRDARTISVTDNGIGMSMDDLEKHLGTVAGSGTRRLLESIKEKGTEQHSDSFIGHFGVGFYSTFIVADQVTVRSRRAGAARTEGAAWSSEGTGEFEMEPLDRPARGTRVTLHLKPDEDEFLDAEYLRELIQKYSDHIAFPVRMAVDDKEQTINKATALWMRSKKDISSTEYEEFYKHITHDAEPPLCYAHNRVEGNVEFTALLYVPSNAPPLWQQSEASGLRLYVRRVFIMDATRVFLPPWLGFVHGVIDCPDLPLNISRETLQQNRTVRAVGQSCVRRVLECLKEMADQNPDNYLRFWHEFGDMLKIGVTGPADRQPDVIELLRFNSTHDEALTGLAAYVKRMTEKQKAIYYLAADNLEAAGASPLLDAYKENDMEVILIGNPGDEWVLAHIPEYDNRPLRPINKMEFDLDTSAETDSPSLSDDLLRAMEKHLAGRVEALRWSQRLRGAPCCLVYENYGTSGSLKRALKAAGHKIETDTTRPTLELNPDHPLLKHISDIKDDDDLREWTMLLFDQAVISEGALPPDHGSFVRRLNHLLAKQIET